MSKKRKTPNYHKLILFILIVLFSLTLTRLEIFHQIVNGLGDFGYLGSFLAGILFVNIFSATFGVVLLITLAETHNPFLLSLLGGAGAVIGDLIIFSYIKYNILDEVHVLLEHIGLLLRKFPTFLSTKYFQWTLPLLGALLIASPFPDELGISLMGISKISTTKFILLTYLLNTLGILSILGLLNYFA